jgi:hypothetical protein
MKNLAFLITGAWLLPALAGSIPAEDCLRRFYTANNGKTLRRLPIDILPENGFWWFTTRDFADGMSAFNHLADEGLAKSTYNCITLSLRCNHELGHPQTQQAARNFFKKAGEHGVKVYMDTDPRIARKEFFSRWPEDCQSVAKIVTAEPSSGMVKLEYVFKDAEDHMTSGAAVSYRPLRARVAVSVAVKKRADGVIDLFSARPVNTVAESELKEWTVPDVEGAGGIERAELKLKVSARGLNDGEVLVAVLLADFHFIDVFSPHLLPFARELMERYKRLGADGGMRDEWGFMPDYLPDLHTFWYSAHMAKEYEKASGRELMADFPLMALGEKGDRARSAAIGDYMQLILKRNVEIEHAFYDADKEIFGEDVYVVKHPTWHCWICPQEYFHNGLDWWQAKRDWAQGDEVTPFYVLTALSKKWGSPVWLNEGYSETVQRNVYRAWSYAMCGGRQVYHCLYSGKPDEMARYSRMTWEERRVRTSLDLLEPDSVRAQAKIRLSNLVTRSPADCPVAFIFGHEKLVDWSGEGWNDHGQNELRSLKADGWWSDAYPASECALGTFKLDEHGYLKVGCQRYSAVVLHQLSENEQKAFQSLARAGRMRTRCFSSADINAAKEHLRACGAVRQPKADMRTPAGAYYPKPDGLLHLVDGTLVRVRADWDNPGGLEICETIGAGEEAVKVEAKGIVAVRIKNGAIEAFAGGAVRSIDGPGLSISLEKPEDIALLKLDGVWHGVWQTVDSSSPVPTALRNLTSHWTRLMLPQQGSEK